MEANAIGSDGKAGTINITFGHVLSYLTVKLKRGDTAKDIRFTSVKLEGCCRMERGFNLHTGKFTDEEEGAGGGSVASGTAESNGSITLYNSAGSTNNGENTDDANTTEESYECLLIPQTFDGTLTVIIEGTDNAGKAKRYSFQATGKSLELLRGHGYTLTRAVGQNKAGIGEVTLNNWQTGEWGNAETPETGTAEEVPPQADARSHTLANFSAGQIAANPSLIDMRWARVAYLS